MYIAAKNDEGAPTGESVHFLVDAVALPRVGDRLHFAGVRTALYLTVREIEHWFFTEDDGRNPASSRCTPTRTRTKPSCSRSASC